MDAYSGNSLEPSSLHEYLYCQANPINGSDPTGNYREIPSNWKLGKEAEIGVVLDFKAKIMLNARSQVSVHGIFSFLSTVGYKGCGRLIPDLVDLGAKEIYDVKSWGELPAGLVKLRVYAQALNDADPYPQIGANWTPGVTYNYGGLNPYPLASKSNGKKVVAAYYPTQDGVIAYRLYEIDDDNDQKRLPPPLLVRARQGSRQSTQILAQTGIMVNQVAAAVYFSFSARQFAIGVGCASVCGIGTVCAISLANSTMGAQ